jgi:hypothetical protein
MQKSICLILFVFFSGFIPTAQADFLGSYYARLSSNDHYNSKGNRLRNAAAIVRQDRANYHRFHIRDSEDNWDSVFGSKQNRARMERMLNRGSWTKGLRKKIVTQTPLIHVEIYTNFINLQVLD